MDGGGGRDVEAEAGGPAGGMRDGAVVAGGAADERGAGSVAAVDGAGGGAEGAEETRAVPGVGTASRRAVPSLRWRARTTISANASVAARQLAASIVRSKIWPVGSMTARCPTTRDPAVWISTRSSRDLSPGAGGWTDVPRASSSRKKSVASGQPVGAAKASLTAGIRSSATASRGARAHTAARPSAATQGTLIAGHLMANRLR